MRLFVGQVRGHWDLVHLGLGEYLCTVVGFVELGRFHYILILLYLLQGGFFLFVVNGWVTTFDGVAQVGWTWYH